MVLIIPLRYLKDFEYRSVSVGHEAANSVHLLRLHRSFMQVCMHACIHTCMKILRNV